MKTRNCHARTKSKRKQLRLKNLKFKMLVNSFRHIENPDHPKARAAMKAFHQSLQQKEFEATLRLKYSAVPVPNQRQKRKLRRQQPHGR